MKELRTFTTISKILLDFTAGMRDRTSEVVNRNARMRALLAIMNSMVNLLCDV